MPATISRSDYAAMFSHTVGDKLRRADPDRLIQVERHLTAEAAGAAVPRGSGNHAPTHGDEPTFVGGRAPPAGRAHAVLTGLPPPRPGLPRVEAARTAPPVGARAEHGHQAREGYQAGAHPCDH